ncbi:MAG: HD-GYP domain-containing protein [Rhodoferax sp.]|uniref:HD-GYP domain-containing protein n=1 Tax=Rhodoferax sp. TaxID=50421 RepID=UPI003018028D
MTQETVYYSAVIDALTAHVALLSNQGEIVAVNESWRKFADDNGSTLPNYGVGSNYLELLRKSAACADPDSEKGDADRGFAHQVVDGISNVLGGSTPKFQLEYPCHAPLEDRWFLLTVTPFSPGSTVKVVVSHENITALKMAEQRAIAQSLKMAEAFSSMVGAIAMALEKRDPYTAGHQRQVAAIAVEIGRVMHLSEDQLFGLHLGATIHDIGKISIPAEILNRPGAMSAPEFMIIRCHPEVGHEILSGIDFPWPITNMVWQHHERLDGSGYPLGLKGEAICLEARILAVADVFDAITSHRPYRPALNIETGLAEIQKGRGTVYDAAVVDAGLSFLSKINADWHLAHRNYLIQPALALATA